MTWRRAALPLMLAVVLAATYTRFHDLGVQSLWNDEGSSYVQATRSFSQIAVNAAADIHPPGYYWALRVWAGLVGTSEFGLRALSALAGVLSVALTYGVGARLYPRRARGVVMGVSGATLVALNTFQIWYGQEARMYAALALWGVGSFWALVGFFNRPTYQRGAALGVVNALGLWTQYAFPLVMLAQLAAALVWLASRWGRGFWAVAWRYIAANLLALALFAPLAPTAIRQVTTWPNTGDVTVEIPAAAGTLLGWYTVGVTVPAVDGSWVAVALMLALLGLVTRNRVDRPRTLVPMALFLVPTAIFLAGGLYREGNIKFLLPSGIGFALAVGGGIAALWTLGDTADNRSRRWLGRAAALAGFVGLVVVVGRAVPPLYTDAAHARNDYRAMAARVASSDGETAVILNAPGQREVWGYYADGEMPVLAIPQGLNADDDTIRTRTLDAADQYERLWLVLWGDTERDPRGVVEQTLGSAAYPASSDWYGDVRLISYATEPEAFAVETTPDAVFDEAITLEGAAVSAERAAPGEILQVRLAWTTDVPLDVDYRVFLQLLDADGRLVVGRDAAPVGWTRPTSTWEPGETIIDRHALILPETSPGTHFRLIVGLYNPILNGERLPIAGTPDNYWMIAPITITEETP